MRLHKWIAVVLAGASACGVGLRVAAAHPQSASESVANGKAVFTSAGCAVCHGSQAQGGMTAPALAPPPLELPALIAYVRRPAGQMPPISEATASDKQLADVFAYLQSLAPKTSPTGELKGNAENGNKLFVAYGCYECHGREGAGAITGPRIGPPAITLAAVLRYVRAPAGQMPPYTAKVVSDQDLADIYAFLKSFPAPRPSKDIPLLNN